MNFSLSPKELVYALDNSNSLFLIVNKALNLLYLNDSAKQLLLADGRNLNQITLYDIFSSSNKILIDTHLLPMLEIRGSIEEISVEIITRTGEQIPSLLNGKKVLLRNDLEVYVLSASKFYQRKLYEKELIFQRQRAENYVSKLENLNSKLEKLTYSLIHDFKAPVNNIIGLIELIDADKDISDEESKYYLDLIKKSAQNLNKMIKEVLNQKFSTPAAKSVVDLNEIIEKVLKLMTAKITESNAKVEVGKLPIVYGNKSLLTRIFQNLLDNAIKFRKKSELPVIKIFAEYYESFAVIYVEDNGQGIEEKELENIFKFGKRSESVKEIEGSGIGLNFCKLALEEMGSELLVTSQKGVGSKFYFSLPIV